MPEVIPGADDHSCPFCGCPMVDREVYDDGKSADCKCVECGKVWTVHAPCDDK